MNAGTPARTDTRPGSTMCTFGAAPSTFNAMPRPVLTSNTPAGVITDNVPIVNIPPFGVCTSLANPQVAAATGAALGVLTPMPCMPVLPTPWVPGADAGQDTSARARDNDGMRRTRLCTVLVLAFAASGLFACTSRQPLPDDGFVGAPGGRIAFRVIGGGDGVPVLLIHGGPGATSCSYVSTVDGIASQRAVVVYDQLGSGNSDRLRDLARDATLPRFVAEVEAIRRQLGLEEVHLVGHSWGATVALEYLLTARPTGVRSVTFAGPLISTPRWIADADELVGQLPEAAQVAIRAAKASGRYDTPEFEAANEVFEKHFGSRAPRQRFPACESVPVPFNSQLYEYMWGPSEFVSTGTLRDYDRLEQLSELNLPTLFLVGQYDEVRVETARDFQSRVPGSILRVIPDAGHGIQRDQPQAFNEVIVEFIRGAEQR